MHHGGDSELYVSAKAKQLTEIDNATHFQQPNLKITRRTTPHKIILILTFRNNYNENLEF